MPLESATSRGAQYPTWSSEPFTPSFCTLKCFPRKIVFYGIRKEKKTKALKEICCIELASGGLVLVSEALKEQKLIVEVLEMWRINDSLDEGIAFV
ncbi:hypothetical protein VNO77_36440 [Canavalia gladiata]|uniref:Uncharacterized protein n=1 Tax=Canavalia gladiata TaxID=3824 RepID=A0AAN9K9J3_CANGL